MSLSIVCFCITQNFLNNARSARARFPKPFSFVIVLTWKSKIESIFFFEFRDHVVYSVNFVNPEKRVTCVWCGKGHVNKMIFTPKYVCYKSLSHINMCRKMLVETLLFWIVVEKSRSKYSFERKSPLIQLIFFSSSLLQQEWVCCTKFCLFYLFEFQLVSGKSKQTQIWIVKLKGKELFFSSNEFKRCLQLRIL